VGAAGVARATPISRSCLLLSRDHSGAASSVRPPGRPSPSASPPPSTRLPRPVDGLGDLATLVTLRGHHPDPGGRRQRHPPLQRGKSRCQASSHLRIVTSSRRSTAGDGESQRRPLSKGPRQYWVTSAYFPTPHQRVCVHTPAIDEYRGRRFGDIARLAVPTNTDYYAPDAVKGPTWPPAPTSRPHCSCPTTILDMTYVGQTEAVTP